MHDLKNITINGKVVLTDFVLLNEISIKEVLEWRNHEINRIFMFNKSIIDYESHIDFINSLKTNNKKQYWLLSYNNLKLGCINVTCTHPGEGTIGFYINPFNANPLVGIILICSLLKICFDFFDLQLVKGEVLPSNVKVIKLHRMLGFCESETKSEHFEVFLMSKEKWLKNNNYFQRFLQ